MESKICSKCKQNKMICEFYKGYKICKKCHSEYIKQWKINNPEKVKIIKQKSKKYYLENKEYINDRNNNNWSKNKHKYSETKKQYRNKNKEKISKYRREYLKKRLKNDINYKIKKNLRTRIHELFYKKIKKSRRTMELVGCSVEFLKLHLESKFQQGMSWGNYGINGWHIDHIVPCASFDLTKEEEQRKCFHYTNLQPLWAKDNIRKSDNLPE